MVTDNQQELDYYAAHSPITDPGEYGYLFDDLPDDIPQLAGIVRGLILHYGWTELYGVKFSPKRFTRDAFSRTISQQLRRIIELSDTPLTEARPPEKRMLGLCRDFSVVLTAILRHKGVPARARCGFATYFRPDHYEDHWVCQYWKAGENRWVSVDAQLNEFQRNALGVPFELTEGQFLPAGQGWQMYRTGKADPATFGYGNRSGVQYIRRNLVHDLFALNKTEMLAWDSWELMSLLDKKIPLEQMDLLDRIALVTHSPSPDPVQVQSVFDGDERLRLPAGWNPEDPVLGLPRLFGFWLHGEALLRSISRYIDTLRKKFKR
ncbi:MAG: transglutaminase domain-containing protein [Dehalococcoidales bacterium]|nr:transglutaminase domain-containing protein [Dehalococcoidales bacterium]